MAWTKVSPWTGAGRSTESVAPMISALRENMASLMGCQEEVIRVLQAHEDEKRHLREQLSREWEEERSAQERARAEEGARAEQEMAEFRAECERRMAEEKAEMARRAAESRAECQRMAEEQVQRTRQLADFRKECERRMAKEKAEMSLKMTEFRAQCERKVEEEKRAMDERLAEARTRTELEIQSERQATDHMRHAMRELPPLQSAMELGDLVRLETEFKKWKLEALPERFGECKGVVEAVVKLAKERLITWRGVEHALKDVLKEAERLPGSAAALMEQCQRVFRALKEAHLTRLDLRRSDPKAMERICEVLFAWQEAAMAHPNKVQRSIVGKVVNCPNLGPFDFTDLDICLRLVDRPDSGSDGLFLTRAQALVNDNSTLPRDLRQVLSHLETMLFFLKYTKSEDLQLTHAEFRKQAGRLDRVVGGYLAKAERDYAPGMELVSFSNHLGLVEGSEVTAVLEEIRKPHAPNDSLGLFREIFYQWAVIMRNKFDLLVMPHHTQVVCLLAFRSFLESKMVGTDPHALIAQVATGEGKSMIIAAIVIYAVVALGKKAHVVVDDETLLERDFWTFKPLFDSFTLPGAQPGAARRPLSSVLCVSEDRLASEKRPCLAARVDPDADVCYCEAKHVQSFYASIARGEKRDFGGYQGRVLILDEVDALIIDEEPNEAFVYRNQELSDMATSIAEALASGTSTEQLVALNKRRDHPSTERVIREMSTEWARGKLMKAGDDFVYAREAGRYWALHAGRANPKAWSLALECRNFQDGLSREILFQERLFVMSRPRVFRKYHRIVGLSGSIGSDAERRFLQETYRAAFFEVPPFLRTCRGSPFHEAVPVGLGVQRRAVYVEATPDAQLARLAEVAFEARDKVPVLIIAKDRALCDQLVERLRQAARSRGFGSTSEDMIRSLSRTLYETNPEQWKENLNRSTQPLGDGGCGGKSWRLTVTDPRGGRGTDYRVDDTGVNGRGGLLLIPTIVPTSHRDWTQFLGRTARQDRRGQFCTVLCATDYVTLSAKYNKSLPSGDGLDAIETILRWGDQEVAERIQASAALYNCGVRVNELCEEVFGRRPELLRDPRARECLVDACQRIRWLSVREIDEAFARMPGLDPSRVPTEARDLGRPVEPPPSTGKQGLDAGWCIPASGPLVTRPPKVLIFCLDWSLSMLSQDTGTALTRFDTCVACIRQILRDQVRDRDLVGVVGFGNKVEVVVLPTVKGIGGTQLDARITNLQAQTLGGTCFFDAVLQCLQLLGQPSVVPNESPRWLVCLTDGDDLGSQRENAAGEMVTRMLNDAPPQCLNMMMITVGKLKEKNVRVIDSWVERVCAAGGLGRHLSEKNASAISSAFSVVAECLAAEVGGAVEC